MVFIWKIFERDFIVRNIVVGKSGFPFWLIIVVMVFGVVSAYSVWQSLTIPFEVKEPVEVVSYPTQLSLYPGERREFEVSLRNLASVEYLIVLEFQLGDPIYQNSYVAFSNKTYLMGSGEKKLTAWLTVKDSAPPITTSLTITVKRIDSQIYANERMEFVSAYSEKIGTNKFIIHIKLKNTGSSDATIDLWLFNGKPATAFSGINISDDINGTTLKPGEVKEGTITLPVNGWKSGMTVEIIVQTAVGRQYTKSIILP